MNIIILNIYIKKNKYENLSKIFNEYYLQIIDKKIIN